MLDRLLGGRALFEGAPALREAGIYVVFAGKADVFPGIEIPSNDVLYVGQSADFASVARSDDHLNALEGEAIKTLEPPLTLTLWENPHKPPIQALRRACRDEAHAEWLRHQGTQTR